MAGGRWEPDLDLRVNGDPLLGSAVAAAVSVGEQAGGPHSRGGVHAVCVCVSRSVRVRVCVSRSVRVPA